MSFFSFEKNYCLFRGNLKGSSSIFVSTMHPLSMIGVWKTLLTGSDLKIKKPSRVEIYILKKAWKYSTQRKHAAAVRKFFAYCKSNDLKVTLPIARKDVCNFIVWATMEEKTRIKASTAAAYLSGLRMWHVLHDKAFPLVSSHWV